MTILLAIALSLIANEMFEVSPWCAAKLVRWAARRRYSDTARAETRAEEWAALIDGQPGNLIKLATGISFAGSTAWRISLGAVRDRLTRRLSIARHELPPEIAMETEGHAEVRWLLDIQTGGVLRAVPSGRKRMRFFDADDRPVMVPRRLRSEAGAAYRVRYLRVDYTLACSDWDPETDKPETPL